MAQATVSGDRGQGGVHTPVADIPGMPASGIVALTRIGVATIGDLLAADFDKIAYVLDSYDDAVRLMREAKTLAAKPGRGASAAPARAPERAPSRSSESASSRAAAPQKQEVAPREAPVKAEAQPREASVKAEAALARAIAAGPGSSSEGLARRLRVALRLAEAGAPPSEVVAAVLLEPFEAGEITSEQIASSFDRTVAALVDESTTLRLVPVSPTGNVPQPYLRQAASASVSARRVCAADLLERLSDGGSTLPGPWYVRSIVAALDQGESIPLVALLRKAAA